MDCLRLGSMFQQSLFVLELRLGVGQLSLSARNLAFSDCDVSLGDHLITDCFFGRLLGNHVTVNKHLFSPVGFLLLLPGWRGPFPDWLRHAGY